MPPAPLDFPCEAYGQEGLELGITCFLAVDARVCESAAVCHTVMTAERQRTWNRISELAAAGHPDMQYLLEEFPTPDGLLGGPASGEVPS